ncbi:MAG: alkaline phosphatase [Armatimonadota bacterium]
MLKSKSVQIVIITTLLAVVSVPGYADMDGRGASSESGEAMTAQLVADLPTIDAKNVIIMISDGMGFYHLDATELYQRGPGATSQYDDFPVRLAVTTFASGGEYNPEEAFEDPARVDEGYTDSAAAGTALATGVKTYRGAIGLDDNKSNLRNIVELAEENGRRTGVVTSVQISHATPATFVAHNESRNNYEEIAKEMLLESPVDVVMGAGHPEYDNTGRLVEGEREYQYVGGLDTWLEIMRGKAGADADGDGDPDPWTLIQDRRQFEELQFGQTPRRVLGVPRVATTLQQSRDVDPDSDEDESAAAFEIPFNENVPTLEMMTRGALNVLDNGSDGLFLMVEGGAVDWASHANQSGRMIEEQIDFNHAVRAVIDWVEQNSSWDETLLIVTSDHECGHLSGPNGDKEWNAPQFRGLGVLPEMEWQSDAHTNMPVPLFARGVGAEMFKDRVKGTDPLWGDFVDNVDIAEIMFASFGATSTAADAPEEDPAVALAQ